MNFTDLKPRDQRAINHILGKGYRLQMCRLPNIEFVNKDSGDVEVMQLPDILAEYDADRREDARMRAAERRAQKTATPFNY